MRTSPECLECLTSTFMKIGRMASQEENSMREISCGIAEILGEDYCTESPADMGTRISRLIMRYNPDPFAQEKIRSKETALSICRMLSDRAPTLENALHAALLGNILDFAVSGWDHNSLDIDALLEMDFAVDHSRYLDDELSRARSVIYLTDNAGEAALDSFLLGHIKSRGISVVLSPKAGPVQNDATAADIEGTPSYHLCDRIVPTAQAVGLSLADSSEEFRDEFYGADLRIFKGMGYYENAFGLDMNSFFIFKAKCDPVARSLCVPRGANVVAGRKYL